VAPLIAAGVARTSRIAILLEVWGETRLAGRAVDLVGDVQTLRRDLDLETVTPEARPGTKPHDVVLVTIDTLRADMTPLHGGPARMPNLEDLAGGAAVFEWAFSPG